MRYNSDTILMPRLSWGDSVTDVGQGGVWILKFFAIDGTTRGEQFLTFIIIMLFFGHCRVDDTNYYYPGAVPSHYAKCQMLTNLGHRFLPS